MEPIKAAVERLKANRTGGSERIDRRVSRLPSAQYGSVGGRAADSVAPINEFWLDPNYLESRRIIAHDGADPRSKSFDMLRTQILQTMDAKGWQILAVTSPTPGCGKTFTAVNLALSIARQPERSVLLVDMDLRQPQVANCLGIQPGEGLISVLEGYAAVPDVICQAQVGSFPFLVLPSGGSAAGSAEWMASKAMGAVLHDFRRDYRSRIVILDMPPVLSSDDVIAVLPQIDCLLLVAAAGITTPAEIQDCGKHLQSADVVRVVVNKTSEPSAQTYGNY